jgi:Zn ribbon nucleic-acid-binding protein
MTMYRLRSVDGKLRSITAGRVLVAEPELRFQSPGTSGWVTVDSAMLAEVARVERRFNELDGRVSWVDEAEANAAAAAARPEPPAGEPPEVTERVASQTPPAPPPTARAAQPAAVSARDVRCPSCGEEDELSGRRSDGQILLSCHTCGYDGPRVAQRLCRTCGGHDVVERPQALVERARGTQLSVVGYTTAVLCRVCDADDLAAALAHGGAVLPKELPTVDPQTLQEMGRRPAASPKPAQ